MSAEKWYSVTRNGRTSIVKMTEQRARIHVIAGRRVKLLVL